MLISIIAAIGKNRELGKNNQLLWHISEDLKRFKEVTSGHVVIMGRKTYESIGKPLPNRLNIIISRDPSFKIQNCIVVHSLEEALDVAKRKPAYATSFAKASKVKKASVGKEEEIFVIGGASVYAQAMNFADKLYLTIVDQEFDADAFFPDYSMFKRKVFEKKFVSGKYYLTFLELERN